MSDACITFNNLTLGYSSRAAVHHLGGIVRHGSLTALIGSNGSGKSTLLKGISGMIKPLSGSVTLAAGTRFAYLPQQSELDRSFPARVIDLVSLGLWPRRGLLGRHKQQDKEEITSALNAVGLEGFSDRPLDTLSGGQLQRALFARVLLQDANLILLDEPFNAIDEKTVADLLGMIKRWHSEKRTVLVVLHDLELARKNFPEALLLGREMVAWGDSQTTLTPENLAKARLFKEAWDEAAAWCKSEASAHGTT